jgi:hypothetical protein
MAPRKPGQLVKQSWTSGREAAVRQRRSDSERCRQKVLDVLAAMRKGRTPLPDAEITRRAGVNSQYLQRHSDLKAEADAVRAYLTQCSTDSVKLTAPCCGTTVRL